MDITVSLILYRTEKVTLEKGCQTESLARLTQQFLLKVSSCHSQPFRDKSETHFHENKKLLYAVKPVFCLPIFNKTIKTRLTLIAVNVRCMFNYNEPIFDAVTCAKIC